MAAAVLIDALKQNIEVRALLAADFREIFGASIYTVGKTLSVQEAIDLILCLGEDTRSRWRAMVAGWKHAVSPEWMMAADALDVRLLKMWGEAKGNAKAADKASLGNNPPKVPRPWDAAIELEKRGGRKPLTGAEREAFMEKLEVLKAAARAKDLVEEESPDA